MRKVAWLGIALAVILGALPYALADRWGLVLACVIAGLLWFVPTQSNRDFLPSLGALSLVGLAVAGQFLSVRPEWLVGQVAITLAAWDLARFSRESEGFAGEANRRALAGLFRAHLVHLGVVVAFGWGIGMAALYLRLSFGFVGALVLSTLVLLGLRQGVRAIAPRVRRSESGLEQEE